MRSAIQKGSLNSILNRKNGQIIVSILQQDNLNNIFKISTKESAQTPTFMATVGRLMNGQNCFMYKTIRLKLHIHICVNFSSMKLKFWVLRCFIVLWLALISQMMGQMPLSLKLETGLFKTNLMIVLGSRLSAKTVQDICSLISLVRSKTTKFKDLDGQFSWKGNSRHF